GVAYRLWGERTQQGLVPYNAPEITEADLAPLALELARWGITEATGLAWLDPPPESSLDQARTLLIELEALDVAGRITAHGERMAGLPLHPRLAHMLLKATEEGQGALACDLAAILAERDPLRRLRDERRCDLALRVEVLRRWRADGRSAIRADGAEPGACAAAERAARQWRRRLRLEVDNGEVDEYQVGQWLALAYPDRVARRRDTREGRYRLSNGRGAQLPSECAAAPDWLVAASLDAAGREGRIFLAAPVAQRQLEQLFAQRITTEAGVRWDGQSGAVVANEERRLGALALSRRPLDHPSAEAVSAAMLEGVKQMGLESLPWNEAARQLQARVESLRHWQPEAGWPNLSDDALYASLAEWLPAWLVGINRRDHLARLDMVATLQGLLDWPLQQRLDTEAPEQFTVPSGARRRLEYFADGSAPVLAVKLQEMFGQTETPNVAGGRVAVKLHLLSPARRPLQVTQDLSSFWENTYPEVKKEMKGRYPKHPWPDDPWSAPATARAKPRK
ncbi:MAG: ATP-dependent helicase C-terminal domain-containing protein, partial [Pseudomonadota bacterium]